MDICSLSNPELQQRFKMIREEILPHARRTEKLANGLAWEFEQSPPMREKLAQLIELERRCCTGLAFELQDRRESNTLRLAVEGIDPGSELLAGLGTTEHEGAD
jgi:hypothetical protein